MEWDGLFYGTHTDVYLPSDDTFLLARAVADAVGPGDRFLEIGCGTGLVAMVAARAGARACAGDVNPVALRLARDNARANRLPLHVAATDLLHGWQGPFDLVAFNPPYLPTAEDEHVHGLLDLAFDGGPDGNRVALRFAAQVRGVEAQQVLVVHSSLSDPRPLVEAMEEQGYEADVAATEEHFMETLTVRRFCSGQ